MQRPVTLINMYYLTTITNYYYLTGVQRPVTCFVRPLDSGRLLESAAQAAHFVSLLRWERAMPVGGTETVAVDVY